MKTTKSPRRVLEYAHLIGKLVLPDYSHPNSPKIFTQPQLFACLVLKEFLRLDYRKLEALLVDAGDLAAVIGLDRVPTFSCFQKAAKRLLLNCHAQRYLDKSIRIAQAQRRLPRRVSLAALDGTGLESQHVSHYYVKRRAAAAKHWQKTTYQRFPKAGILCDTKTHLVLAVVPERGPGSDVKHFRRALTEAQSRVKIETLAADAGYDGEHHHRFARERCGVRSLIPPRIGRPTTKPPSGYWRRQMKQRLHLTRYSQRWQAETVNSMLKRLLGSALRARKYWSQCREILLRAITLNIMILRRLEVFYRARMSPLFAPFVCLGDGLTPERDACLGTRISPGSAGATKTAATGICEGTTMKNFIAYFVAIMALVAGPFFYGAAAPRESRAEESAEVSLEVQYAQAKLELAKANLKKVDEMNRRVAKAVSSNVVAEYRNDAAIAKRLLENARQGKADEYSLWLQAAEANWKSARSAWQSAVAANDRQQGTVDELDVERLRLQADVLRLNVERGRALVDRSREEQLEWRVSMLNEQVERLAEVVFRATPSPGRAPVDWYYYGLPY